MAAQQLLGILNHLPTEFKALSILQKNNPTKFQVILQVLLDGTSGLTVSTVYLE